MSAVIATNQTILVVGGGISGMTAALEAAECGKQVRAGGEIAHAGRPHRAALPLFPQAVPPDLRPRDQPAPHQVEPQHPRADAWPRSPAISGERGDYTATVKIAPRYVNENCTACGDCAEAVAAEVTNPYNYGLNKMKAAYLPHAMAYPQRYVLDPSHHRHARDGRRPRPRASTTPSISA